MSPSRRQLLRSGALSLSILGGCAMTDGLNSAESSKTTQSLTTSKAEETTTTTEKQPSLPCDLGPHLDSGWPLPNGSPGRTNYAPNATGPTTTPTVEWSVPAPDSEFGYEDTFTGPTVADGRVYVGRPVMYGKMSNGPDKQYVYAYDAETGEQVWRAAVPGRPKTPMVTGNLVLVHTRYGRTLYAFDTTTGENKWARSLRSIDRILPTPDGILVASSYYNTGIRSYDTDGHLNWHIEKYVSDITWANGIVYGESDGHLVAIETANGTVAWTCQLQYNDNRFSSYIAMSCVVLVATDTILQAVRQDGTQAWSVDAKIRKMATDGERIFAVDESGHLRCIGVADGKQRWKLVPDDSKDDPQKFGVPVVGGKTMYVGTYDGTLVAFSVDDGSEQWRLDSDWSNLTNMVLANETLYTLWHKHKEDGPDKDHLVAFR